MTSPRFPIIVGIWAIAALAFFIVPWHIPQTAEPSLSIAFVCGFNNRAAQVILAIAVLTLTIVGLRSRTESKGMNRLLDLIQRPRSSGPRLRRAFWGISAIALLGIAALYSVLPNAYFAEMQYFLYNLNLLLLGQRLYVDFDFVYGPWMLVIPQWLVQASHGLLSPELAYVITLEANWMLGLYLLHRIVSYLNLKVLKKETLFLMVAVTMLNPTMGLNYTPLRFTLPLVSLLTLHQLTSNANSVKGALLIAIPAMCAPALALMISPEMGIATAASLVIYFAAQALFKNVAYALAALLAAASLCVPSLAYGRYYFDSCLHFSSGFDFPIFPTAHILFFFAAVLTVLPILACGALRWPREYRPLAMGLCIQLGLLIPSALGRCDPGHIFLNGLGIVILFFALCTEMAADTGIRRPKWIVAGFAILFPVWGVWFNCEHHWRLIGDALRVREVIDNGPSYTSAAVLAQVREMSPNTFVPINYDKLLPYGDDFKTLLKYPKVGTPFGSDEHIEKFLILSGRFVPEYLVTIVTRSCLERKLQEMDRMEIILVPKSALQFAGPSDIKATANAWSAQLQDLFLFPISLKPRNEAFARTHELIHFVFDHYAKVDQFRSYFIFERRTRWNAQ